MPQKDLGADVEDGRSVGRSQAESLPRSGKVPWSAEGPDPSVSHRDCAEPQAPALPTLLLAVSAPLVLFNHHRTGIAIQPIATTNRLLKQKSIRTFSTGPTVF